MLIQGTVASKFQKLGNGSIMPQGFRVTAMQSLAVDQVMPANAELARAGRRFHGGCQVIANGIAPVQVIPTTTATVALYNGDASRTYYIDALNLWLGSGTPAAGLTLFATVSRSKIVTAPTAMLTNWGVQSSSGSVQTSAALWAAAVTMPSIPGAPAWAGLVSTFQLAAANVGQGDNLNFLNGQIAVPPGYALGFGILSGAGTTPLYGISATWAEVENTSELE